MRWIVTSTWGQHHVVAPDENDAELRAEDFLAEQGYPAPSAMILDGMTEEYDPATHGEWEGDEVNAQ